MQLAKHISIYISDKHKQLIIAPVHYNDAGILYEQENCFTSNYPIDLNSLGIEAIHNLNLFSKEDRNLRDSKASDWPAFKHSKLKTIKAFEEDYICISVYGVNTSNLILEIKGLPFKNSDIGVNSIISFYADKEEIGKRILSVYDACYSGKLF